MQRMGLTGAELKTYHEALRSSHPIRISLAVLDLEENQLASITPAFVSGQVTVNAHSRETTRVLSAQFWDPGDDLDLDSSNQSDGALFIDRMMRVYYSVWVDALGRWVTAKPFTGPIWHLHREGGMVTVEAHGKERIALRPAWKPFHESRGTAKAAAIRALMVDRTGEARFAFPSSSPALPGPFNVGREQIVWHRATHLARSMDRHLFYDGRGVLHLRNFPDRPMLTFAAGNGGSIISPVGVDTDPTDFVNTVQVKGRQKLEPVVAKLANRNPMSAKKLTRNGVPGVIARFEQNDHIRSDSEETARADRVLAHAGKEVVTYTYDVVPHPHLDELDVVRALTSEGSVRHHLAQWVLPLTTEGNPPMTVGYTKRLTPNRRAIRRP